MLRLGWAVYIEYDNDPSDRHYKEWCEYEPFFFTSVKQFHDWLDGKLLRDSKTRVWLVSHNLKFDWAIAGLDAYFGRTDIWKAPDLEVIEDHPCIYKVRSVEGGHGVVAMSTTNWYQDSLDKIAEAFGLEVRKSPHPDPKSEAWDRWEHDAMKEYCLNDVVMLKEIFVKHVENIRANDWGTCKETAAGQAWAMLFHRYIPFNTMFVHQEPRTMALECDAMKGGRTECFRLGAFHDMFLLDVKSMYPSVMHSNLFPTKPFFHSPKRLSEHSELPLDEAFVIAQCLIDLKRPAISYRTPERLINPIGRLRVTLGSPEIEMLLEDSSLCPHFEVEEYMSYHQTNVFRQFIDDLYAIKESGNPVQKKWAKTSMNSSFGKFCQHDHAPSEDVTDLEGADTKALMLVRDWTLREEFSDGYVYYLRGGRLLRQRSHWGEGLAENAMPAVAAAVTSYARVKLWKEGISPLYDKGLAYYCDTDSMFTPREGLGLMPRLGVGLGDWAVKKGPSEVTFINPKYYILDGERISKGVPKEAVKVGEHTFEYEQFMDGKSRLKTGVPDGIPMRTIRKVMDLGYKKGVAQPNGTIDPFVLKDW